MSFQRNGKTYYSTAEACELAGISKSTFLRWVKENLFADVKNRDLRGWRIFTEEDVDRLKREVERIQNLNIAQKSQS